jgi:hypothetical protein
MVNNPDFHRNLYIIISIGLLITAWFSIPDGRFRNMTLIIFSSITFYLLLTPGLSTIITEQLPKQNSRGLISSTESLTNSIFNEGVSPLPPKPSESLEECLRFHRMYNHPAAEELLNRINDYRNIIIQVAKERNGLGNLWRGVPDDSRISGCLCGSLTRDEVIKALEIKEDDPEPPKVGAGMGIEQLLRGNPYRGNILDGKGWGQSSSIPPLAEDGHLAVRVLHDPVADRLFNSLIQHRPEATNDLFLAKQRYQENVLRRLVGPLDGRGKPIFPLCRWRKRYDGSHFSHFEDIENMFSG